MEENNLINPSEMMECAICLETILDLDRCINNCGHSFCKSCIDGWLDQGKHKCPLCRQNIQYFQHNNKEYRLVVTSDTPTNHTENRPRSNISLLPVVVSSERRLFNTFKIVFLSLLAFTTIQSYYFHYIKKNYFDLLNQYHRCEQNNTDLQDMFYPNGDEHLSRALVYDRSEDMLKPCLLPNSILDRCFT